MPDVQTRKTKLYQVTVTEAGRPEDILFIVADKMATAYASYMARPEVTEEPYDIKRSRHLDMAELVVEEVPEVVVETRYIRDDGTVSMLAHPAGERAMGPAHPDYAAHVMHRYLHDAMSLTGVGMELGFVYEHADPDFMVNGTISEIARVFKVTRGDVVDIHADSDLYREGMTWTLYEKQLVLARRDLDTPEQLSVILGRSVLSVKNRLGKLAKALNPDTPETPNDQDAEGTQETAAGTD